jgi:hypothetical protein
MILRQISVQFSTGSSSLTRDCNVEFGIELLREIDENIDNTLSEAFADEKSRLIMTIDKLLLNISDALWFAKTFLPSDSKTLIIDGTELNVVGADESVKFELWKDRNVYAALTLKFKCKSPGIAFEEVLQDYQTGEIIYGTDGEPITFQEE